MQLYPIPSRCGYKLRKHQHYSERKTKYHSCQLPPLRLFPLQSWKILPGFQSMNTVAAPVDSQAVLRMLLAMKVSVSRFLPCEVIVWTWIHDTDRLLLLTILFIYLNNIHTRIVLYSLHFQGGCTINSYNRFLIFGHT